MSVPPSRIEELEHLVSNLRRDLQVAHDALIAHKSALEKAKDALVDAQNALRSSDDNEQMACIASLEVHLAVIDEVLK